MTDSAASKKSWRIGHENRTVVLLAHLIFLSRPSVRCIELVPT